MSDRDAVLSLLQEVDAHAAERYALCGAEGHGRFAECSQAPIGSESAHPHRYVPFSCMLRICPRCARALSRDLKRKYTAVVEQVLQEQGWKVQRGWRMRHVTLTTSHLLVPDAGAHVLQLLDAARDLFHALWGASEGAGAVASIEVGERGHKFHVHMVVWGPFFSHEAVKAEWIRLTGQEVVWLQEVGATVEQARGTVSEVLKYAVKFSDLEPETLVALHLALKGRRRVRSWGSFYASGVTVEREPETCEVCGARMMLTPEWVIEARLKWAEQGDSTGLYLIHANKSPPRSPPGESLKAPHPLGGGVWSAGDEVEGAWSKYAEAIE